jgi:hypothetical protein
VVAINDTHKAVTTDIDQVGTGSGISRHGGDRRRLHIRSHQSTKVMRWGAGRHAGKSARCQQDREAVTDGGKTCGSGRCLVHRWQSSAERSESANE